MSEDYLRCYKAGFFLKLTRCRNLEDATADALLYVDCAFRNRLALAGKISIGAYLTSHRNDLLDYMRNCRGTS